MIYNFNLNFIWPTFNPSSSYFPLIEDYSSKHIVTTHPYSIFIHRLAVSCRPMLVSNPSSNEQRSQVTLNSIALSALTIAIVDLPSKGNGHHNVINRFNF